MIRRFLDRYAIDLDRLEATDLAFEAGMNFIFMKYIAMLIWLLAACVAYILAVPIVFDRLMLSVEGIPLYIASAILFILLVQILSAPDRAWSKYIVRVSYVTDIIYDAFDIRIEKGIEMAALSKESGIAASKIAKIECGQLQYATVPELKHYEKVLENILKSKGENNEEHRNRYF